MYRNLLKNWEEKESYKNTLLICPIYFSKKTEEKDILLSNLLKKEETLTLDFGETGFKEIGYVWMEENIPKKYKYLVESLKRTNIYEMTSEQLAKDLVEKIKEYFIKVWNSSKIHIILIGGGYDSRILGYVLRDLKRDMGDDWFGDYHIRCHEPESFVFKDVMRRQEWKDFSIYREGKFEEVGYYERMYHFSENVNAFHRTPIEFCRDLEDTLRISLLDAQVISGNGGGELFDTPVYMKSDFTIPFINMKTYFAGGKFNLSYDFAKWGDILTPYLSYSYLDLAFRIPVEYANRLVKIEGFVEGYPELKTLETGFMRFKMLEYFDDDIPICQGHRYNMSMTEERKQHVKDAWFNSDFYKDFEDVPEVRNAKPYLSKWNTLDNKLYSLATAYGD